MLDSARASYTAAEGMRISVAQRQEVSNRLVLLTRRELVQDARQSLAREAELSSSPPVQNTIAVFPWRYRGADEELRPLERGLSYLFVTDLSRVSRLRLLERERVQALLDEMKLTDSGRVDPNTGARSGRIMRAERVVQGTLQDQPGADRLRLDANVIDATTSNIQATGTATDRLQQLLDAEKQVVFQLLDRMGIVLSPVERRAISERPTADLQAFLAFSRGLEDEDRGDFQGAANEYNAALARDPNFRSARERRTVTLQLSSAIQTPPPQLAGLAEGRPLTGGRTTGPAQVQPPRQIVLQNLVGGSVPSNGGLVSNQIPGGPPDRPAGPPRGAAAGRPAGHRPHRPDHHHHYPAVRISMRTALLSLALLAAAIPASAQDLVTGNSVIVGVQARGYSIDGGPRTTQLAVPFVAMMRANPG